jgi:hypothetical protein
MNHCLLIERLSCTDSAYIGYSVKSKRNGSSKKGGKNSLFFRLNFDFDNVRSAKIHAKDGDNLYRLPQNFAVTYKLGNQIINKVWNLLKHTAKVLYSIFVCWNLSLFRFMRKSLKLSKTRINHRIFYTFS